jgi:hypothetical protein
MNHPEFESSRINFDDDNSLTETDYANLTGLSKAQSKLQ